MTAYELSDRLVDHVIHRFDNRNSTDQEKELVRALKSQRPIPVPNKVGAVVRTDGGVQGFTLWVLCQLPSAWTSPEDPTNGVYVTPQIGGITEVLAIGVTL
ncbi:hypothetical protein [Kribbella sp. NPDC051718]|uniref:hypothetical protein n=1 Tax=Kribbella sp. NPDC051718 TaxID=3155168 RepID=UPI003435F496